MTVLDRRPMTVAVRQPVYARGHAGTSTRKADVYVPMAGSFEVESVWGFGSEWCGTGSYAQVSHRFLDDEDDLPPTDWSIIRDRLLAACKEPPNWDGRGARPVEREGLLTAISVLARVMPSVGIAPAIVPTRSGGLQMEWHSGQVDLEVLVDPQDDVYVVYTDHETAEDWEGDLFGNVERIREKILELSRRVPSEQVSWRRSTP